MTHPFREALGRPISHAIYPPDSQRSGAVEANPAVEQRADGGSIRRAGRTAMAEIHGWGESARNQSAHFVLRDGAARTGCADARSNLEPDARGRRDDQAGLRITSGGALAPALPKNRSLIVRDALRAAAQSDRPNDAIGILGEALLRVTESVRQEVRHG